MKRIFNILAIGFVFFSFFSGIAFAEHEVVDNKALLTWTANTEADLAGYKVYLGTESGVYGDPTDSVEPIFLFEGLAEGTYFFAVTAFDTSGNESGFSTEVSKTIAVEPGDHTPPVNPIDLLVAKKIAQSIKNSTDALVMLVGKDEASGLIVK